ncbi:MAG: glycosyltransferase family 39 protein, partial [Candidatus Eiseniibacteriota bacterium]
MSTLVHSAPRPVTSRALGVTVVVVAVACAVPVAVSSLGPALVCFALLAALGATTTLGAAERDRESLLAAYLVALALRVIVMLALTWGFRSPDNPGGFLYRDSIGYHRVGSDLAELHREELPFRIAYHTTGSGLSYHRIVGYLYIAFGTSPWIGKLSNAVLGALAVLLTYGFARPLVGSRGARMAAWMMALWPTAIYWSAQLLKDTLVQFLVILAAWLWVRFAARGSRWSALLAVAAIVPLFWVRIYTFAFLAIGFYVTLVVRAWLRGQRPLAVVMVLAAVAGWSVPFELGLVQDPEVLVFRFSLNDPTTAGSMMKVLSHGGTGMAVLVPLAVVRFFLSPLPWKASGQEIMSVPGILAQYAILPFAAYGGLLLLRRRLLEVLPAVLVVVLTVILYAFVFLGANPRHMQMFYPFL